MKRLLIALLFITCIPLFSQGKISALQRVVPEYLSVTFDSSSFKYVYFLFHPAVGVTSSQRFAPSTTAPSASSYQAVNREFVATGDLMITMETDTLVRDESDSLQLWIRPYAFDKTKQTWYMAANDSTFLVFGTVGTYTATSVNTLNWTHGKSYMITLSNALWPCDGFVIGVKNYQYDTAGAQTKLNFGFYQAE